MYAQRNSVACVAVEAKQCMPCVVLSYPLL
jgi:hypothetical protein